jgi:hypothetical protein
MSNQGQGHHLGETPAHLSTSSRLTSGWNHGVARDRLSLLGEAGHVASKRMVEQGRSPSDVLIHPAAVRVESCPRGVARNGDGDGEWMRLKQALDTFIR